MEIVPKNTDTNVKVYFIDPIRSISLILDVLINLNFEVYSVAEKDIYRLASLIKTNYRSIVYFCLLAEVHTAHWLQYIDMLQKQTSSLIQFGVFVSPNISQQTRLAFLNRAVATIDLYQFQTNPLTTLKKVLLYFEAREKRKFVKAQCFHNDHVFFKLKNLHSEIKATLLEISIQAFSCKILPNDKNFFTPKTYIQDVSLYLRGKQLKISALFMGFDQSNPSIGIFLLTFPQTVNNRLEFHSQLPKEIRKAIFDFILIALKEELRQKLSEMPEEHPSFEVEEIL